MLWQKANRKGEFHLPLTFQRPCAQVNLEVKHWEITGNSKTGSVSWAMMDRYEWDHPLLRYLRRAKTPPEKKKTLKAGKETGHHFPGSSSATYWAGKTILFRVFLLPEKRNELWTNPIQAHRSCWQNNHGSFLPPFPLSLSLLLLPYSLYDFYSFNKYVLNDDSSWTLWQKLGTLHREYSPLLSTHTVTVMLGGGVDRQFNK